MLRIVHPRAIRQRMLKQLFCIISLKIILLELQPYLPGANKFIEALTRVADTSRWKSFELRNPHSFRKERVYDNRPHSQGGY